MAPLLSKSVHTIRALIDFYYTPIYFPFLSKTTNFCSFLFCKLRLSFVLRLCHRSRIGCFDPHQTAARPPSWVDVGSSGLEPDIVSVWRSLTHGNPPPTASASPLLQQLWCCVRLKSTSLRALVSASVDSGRSSYLTRYTAHMLRLLFFLKCCSAPASLRIPSVCARQIKTMRLRFPMRACGVVSMHSGASMSGLCCRWEERLSTAVWDYSSRSQMSSFTVIWPADCWAANVVKLGKKKQKQKNTCETGQGLYRNTFLWLCFKCPAVIPLYTTRGRTKASSLC